MKGYFLSSISSYHPETVTFYFLKTSRFYIYKFLKYTNSCTFLNTLWGLKTNEFKDTYDEKYVNSE